MLDKGITMRFYKKLKAYINTSLKFHYRSRIINFFPKLLISYYVVIAVCVCSMGILSYSFISNSIKEQSIKSNDKLLKQFKNTVDSLILSSINDLSLKILQDTKTNPYIAYYFSYSMENNIYDMVKILEYCDTLKAVNPMIYSVGIYFEKNQLFISNEGVRSTEYNKQSTQNDFMYYFNLITESTSNPSWHVNNGFEEDFANNTGIRYNNLINMVRKVPVISNTTNVGGAIIISIDQNVLYKLIKKTAAQDLDDIIICDSKGSIITHTDKDKLGHDITDFVYGDGIINAPESLGNFVVNISEMPSIVSFCTSEYNDWKYITVTPMEKYNSATGFLIRIIIFVTLAAIIVGLFISLIPAFNLSIPLRRLVGFCISVNKTSKPKQLSEYNIIKSTIESFAFNMKQQEQKFIDVLPILKENFLQCIISGQCTDLNEIKIRMQVLDFTFPYKYFCTLAVSTKKYNTSDGVLLNEYMKINIADAIRRIYDSHASKCYICDKDGNLTVIINFDMEEKIIHELLNSLEITNDNNLSEGLYISMGIMVEGITNIVKSYTTADAGLKYTYLFPERQIILANDIISREANHILPDKNLLNNFIASLRKQDRNNTINDLCNIITTLRTGDFTIEHIMESLSKCVATVDEYSASVHIPINAIYSEDGNISRQFKKIANVIDFQNWMTEIIIYIFDSMSSMHSEINKELVNKTIDQIKKNITNPNLSLKTVAGTLYISQSHLSRIFKSETGTTFIDYITGLKLDYCKDLLLSTTMKIDEIALTMGYSTSHYFISRFKIKFGCTPKEYRSKNGGVAKL